MQQAQPMSGGIYGDEALLNSIPLMPRELQQMMLSADQAALGLDFGEQFGNSAPGGNSHR